MYYSSWDDRKYIDRSDDIRRDFSRRGLRPPPGAVFWFAFGVMMLLVIAVIKVGPDISVAEGHCTRGYFVSQTRNYDWNGCGWSGQFRLPGGKFAG